jgi:hypothetical protein
MDPDQVFRLDPDPQKTDADPKHWLKLRMTAVCPLKLGLIREILLSYKLKLKKKARNSVHFRLGEKTG